MSDTKKITKSASKPESKVAAKPAESKTTEAGPAESKSVDDTSAPVSPDSSEGGRSARESIGGEAVGHYGYFSNIKTPEYKSGWDDIWGKKKSGGKKKAITKLKAVRKPMAPRVVSLDFEDLPSNLRAALAKEARAQFKKARVNYDNRDKAGAVEWRIDCIVER